MTGALGGQMGARTLFEVAGRGHNDRLVLLDPEARSAWEALLDRVDGP